MAAAIAFAKEMGAALTAYYAIEASLEPHRDPAMQERRLFDLLGWRERDTGRKVLDGVRDAARLAGVACDTVIDKPARPYKGIIAAAASRKCQAIFMASHGHRGAQALMLGSVTRDVLTHSKIPVFVFR